MKSLKSYATYQKWIFYIFNYKKCSPFPEFRAQKIVNYKLKVLGEIQSCKTAETTYCLFYHFWWLSFLKFWCSGDIIILEERAFSKTTNLGQICVSWLRVDSDEASFEPIKSRLFIQLVDEIMQNIQKWWKMIKNGGLFELLAQFSPNKNFSGLIKILLFCFLRIFLNLRF